mmetsp:Transcript_27783/g.85902  ORF Transcript_27783/g.85902 Transcript_27783/m.85902 type:complete len:238 (-) Transcript_27783:44-757(-)
MEVEAPPAPATDAVANLAAEFAPKRKRLDAGQRRRIFAEDRFRELQRENRGALNDYEEKEAQSVCDQGLARLKATLAADLATKRSWLERLRADASAAADALESGQKGLNLGPERARPPWVDDGLVSAEDARADMAAIVAAASAEARAMATAADDADCGALRVGDELQIFSKTERTELVGRLVGADAAKLTLELADGSRVQFSVDDLKTQCLVATVAGASPPPAPAPAEAAGPMNGGQ